MKNLYKVKWTETHVFEAEVYADDEDEAIGFVSDGLMVSIEKIDEWVDDAEATLLESGYEEEEEDD